MNEGRKKKKEQKYLLETFSKAQSNAHYNDIDEIDATKSHEVVLLEELQVIQGGNTLKYGLNLEQ